ncbi:MAG: efflux RND transporter periplasmic adaptor subunit [bacterium]|nr:efflux RND transporter periplasmic adaptor subunit [bacterium]
MTKKQIYIIGTVVLLIVLGYLFFGGSKNSSYSYVQVSKGDVIQEVSVTGRVKPSEDVSLAFEKGGRITSINIKVGDKAYKGQILMRLDNSELLAQLAGAEANLKSQQAKLDELKKGTRPEEIKIQEVKVSNAQTVVSDAKNSAIDDLRDAYIKSDDAIHNKVDQFFDNPKSQNPTLSFSMVSSQLKTDLEWERLIIGSMFSQWKTSLDKLLISSDITSSISEGKRNLNQVDSFLNKAASAVNGLLASSEVSQTSIDAWKAAVVLARTNISASIISITDAEQALTTANSDLSVEENDLILEKAGTIPEQISAQEALVDKAKADADVYRAQIDRTYLRSPIGGIITKQDTKLGEMVSANVIIVSVMSDQQYDIEVDVPEADIAKIKIGNSAKVTLDAYGSDVFFDAHVVSIDPAETMVDNAATYKTTLQFDKKEDMIKSGMTANIDILTNKKEGVLILPQRAVLTKDGEKFVQLNTGKNVIENKKIDTGLKGSDGNIEIVSGLNDGDKVISAPVLE